MIARAETAAAFRLCLISHPPFLMYSRVQTLVSIITNISACVKINCRYFQNFFLVFWSKCLFSVINRIAHFYYLRITFCLRFSDIFVNDKIYIIIDISCDIKKNVPFCVMGNSKEFSIAQKIDRGRFLRSGLFLPYLKAGVHFI